MGEDSVAFCDVCDGEVAEAIGRGDGEGPSQVGVPLVGFGAKSEGGRWGTAGETWVRSGGGEAGGLLATVADDGVRGDREMARDIGNG